MASVAALYRYPVKGFTPESCQALSILPSGRVGGDRVLGFRFADTPEADSEWSRKQGMLVLQTTPGLARITTRFDDAAGRLALWLGKESLADEALDDAGRKRLAEVVAAYALDLEENPLSGHPEHLPLRLIGDGQTPRYTDAADGTVTLHGRGSLEALRAALGDPEASELRFRSNVAVEGLEAWEEHEWEGRVLRIGSVEFDVLRPKRRCLATHANPVTGERDHQILTTLTHAFDQEVPTFAISLMPRGGGDIHVGDGVEVV